MKRFRTLAILIAAVLGSSAAMAQMNSNHLTMNVGAFYERGLDATVALDHEGRYHNLWEYFFNYTIKYEKDPEAGHYTVDSFWNTKKAWGLGIAYKPCVARARNNHGNLRLGASFGSYTNHDDAKFNCIMYLGYEHSYQLRHGWQIFWQARCDVQPSMDKIVKVGGTLGLKLPLDRR